MSSNVLSLVNWSGALVLPMYAVVNGRSNLAKATVDTSSMTSSMSSCLDESPSENEKCEFCEKMRL